MKRLLFCALSVFAISSLTGCCCPGWGTPWGGGCWGGQCGVQPYGAYPGAATPSSYYTPYDSMQTAYPMMTTPIATPITTYPTVALESLPTYR